MRKIILLIALVFSAFVFGQKEFVELRVYEMSFGKSAKPFYNYVEKALIPALNRQGIENVGFFEEIGDAMPKKVYLLISHKDMNSFNVTLNNLKEDATFQVDAQDYLNTPQEKFPFNRYTTSLFTAFDGFPKTIKPVSGSTVFELRTYEAYNEDALRRKIKMFNESELEIFNDVGLHSVFFGEKISGPNMPCLTYMLAFKDMEERDENWSKFGPHPEWQRIKDLPEYAYSVSNISRVFLKPFDFSQL